ncbi:antibiotic biosynthesis monooxygenase [Nakamurella lactea]|uniref:antibiotic biosynthesis monooxygenase n=1 Tax=Nakamurella lactea TaxID=459515 RepID=UPI0012B5EDA9|nr:antibiotic biosynthesis monooxygenase [Nakamurella lactea]
MARFDQPAPAGVLELFAAQPSCDRLVFARSTDEIDHYVLVAEFADAPSYRRALSPFDVRTTVIPWLSTAAPGSGVNEALAVSRQHRIVEHEPTVTPGPDPRPLTPGR